tara:strand:- start:21 stop:146 length:126 start_codon:yes stop_codon:yes gene_type:complete
MVSNVNMKSGRRSFRKRGFGMRVDVDLTQYHPKETGDTPVA